MSCDEKMKNLRCIWTTVALLLFIVSSGESENLTCYQCEKQTNEECSEKDLKPCGPEKDRCVTHITKDARNGFSIKRECGLGPCGFADDMMNKGLGLDGCDRSKDEYFCLFCCRTSGCNKSEAPPILPSFLIISFSFISLIFINADSI